MTKTFKILTLLVCLVLLFGAAQQSLAIGDDYQNFLEQTGQAATYDTSAAGQGAWWFADSLIARIIQILISLLGLIFLIFAIYSGIQMMTASGNEEKVTAARKRLLNAIIGVAVVALAYILTALIFNFLDERFLTNTGNIPTVNQ
jgi:hypothetical protein